MARQPGSVDQYIRQGGLRAALPAKHVAGLIFTYRCSIACRHCLFSCGPSLPDVAMSADQAARAILDLHEMDRVVHVAGGEALLHPDVVLEAARRSAAAGRPPHFVETNAFWCTSDELTERRLRDLREAGVVGLYISSDLWHQEFVSAECVIRCRRIADAIFGEANVLVPRLPDDAIRDLQRRAGRPDQIADTLRLGAPRLIGRAARELAAYLPLRPIEALADDAAWGGARGMPCADQFDPDRMWEVHVDPYGHIQTCCGVILGHLRDGPVHVQARRGWLEGNPIAAALSRQGPVGLLPLAQARGHQPQPAYPQKCALCYELRYVLRPFYPQFLGPDEVYSVPPPTWSRR